MTEREKIPDENQLINLNSVGTYEGAGEALDQLSIKLAEGDFEEGEVGRDELVAVFGALRRIRLEHFMGWSGGANLWEELNFLSEEEKLATAKALRQSGIPVKPEQIGRLEDLVRKTRGADESEDASEAEDISFTGQAYLGVPEGEEGTKAEGPGFGRSMLFLAGLTLAVKAADMVFDSQEQIRIAREFERAQSRRSLEAERVGNKKKNLVFEKIGKYIELTPTPIEPAPELEIETEAEPAVEVAAPLQFENIFFDKEEEQARITITASQDGEEPKIPSLSFVASVKPLGENIDRDCYEEGSGKACVYEFDDTILVVVHTGFDTDGSEPLKLEGEDWRAFVEGEEPYFRLPQKDQVERIERMRSVSWDFSQLGEEASGLSMVWVERVPIHEVFEFDKNIEAIYDFFPGGVGEAIQAMEGKKVTVVYCGRYTPGEAEPGTRPAYSWSRFVHVFAREKLAPEAGE